MQNFVPATRRTIGKYYGDSTVSHHIKVALKRAGNNTVVGGKRTATAGKTTRKELAAFFLRQRTARLIGELASKYGNQRTGWEITDIRDHVTNAVKRGYYLKVELKGAEQYLRYCLKDGPQRMSDWKIKVSYGDHEA